MQKQRDVAVRSGLSWGVVLVICELGFGIVMYLLLPGMTSYIRSFDLSMLSPVITVYLAYLFLLIAIYFTCGMITAKWLISQPLKSIDIAKMGALSGAIAESLRSIVAVPINIIISLLFPFAPPGTSIFSAALGNAAARLFCGLPVFVILAAAVAGTTAYIFSMIFFRETKKAQ
ncbi:MAG TPA: hypothetical protein VK436_16130 [Methanocella sp.]|nr:hypothetical protein [Methanocella sp.]